MKPLDLTLDLAPSVEPLSTAEAKLHLKVEESDDDALIDSLVVAAREYVEAHTRRQLVSARWILYLDRFPLGTEPIVLPLPPLDSITSVQYIDTDGNQQTWSSSEYVVRTGTPFGTIEPGFDYSYPAARIQPQSITVTFVAGYGVTAAEVPDALRAVIRLLVGHWYENRESVAAGGLREVPQTVEFLLNAFRLPQAY